MPGVAVTVEVDPGVCVGVGVPVRVAVGMGVWVTVLVGVAVLVAVVSARGPDFLPPGRSDRRPRLEEMIRVSFLLASVSLAGRV